MLLFIIIIILICLILLKFLLKPGKFVEPSANEPNNNENLIDRINQQIILLEVLRQSKLVGDKKTQDEVTDCKYDGDLPIEKDGRFTSIYPDKLMILSIAGINYRGNLKPYVGRFKGVLVPEPNNDYDPNAIMVKCEDGKHLGYVAESMTQEVRDFIGVKGSEWRHRITGDISECEDEDDEDESRKFFSGTIYIVKP